MGSEQPVWQYREKTYVLEDSWRTKFMLKPPEADVNLAEMATWYKEENDKNITINKQSKEHLLTHILLKDGKTVLKKKKHKVFY